MTTNKDLKPYQRLDQFMIEHGLVASRSRATDAISRGVVFVDGHAALKASQKVSPHTCVTLDDPAEGYVSRAALKLITALDTFEFLPNKLKTIDIGASTGGFTQVLIQRGAARVYAVDVGHDQLHKSILLEERVTNLEGLNARHLTFDHIGEMVDAIVSDVSFISLKLALPPALKLTAPGAWLAALVKPQFEVGRAGVGKGGIVRDPTVGKSAAEQIADWLNKQQGWTVTGLVDCPITGSDGNQEYLLGAKFDG